MGGSVSSCCLPRDREDNERDRILQDPTRDDSYGNLSGHHEAGQVGQFGHTNSHINENGSNEATTPMQRTLHKLAHAVIDVASVDVITLEQQEWNERSRAYSSRVSALRTPMALRSSMRLRQPSHSHSPPPAANYDALHEDDVKYLIDVAERNARAIKEGFVIHGDQAFVVQFDP